MKNKIIFTIWVGFTLFSTQLVQAQSASIKGVITDAKTGEKLPGANIFLHKKNIGSFTNTRGYFELLKIPAGTYKLKTSFIGYKEITKQITLKKGENKNLNITLDPIAESLKEVIITAKTKARELREKAMPISVISMNEIQGTVSDVNEVLVKTTGLKLRNTGGVGSSSRISLRGLEGKRIGCFIDDSPMNDNSDFMNLNDIPIDLIDRIEIYKGIVPAKLGGSAIGGAINIVTKEYPPIYTDVSYTLSSFNTHKISTATKRNKNDYEYGFGGFYTYSDNDYKMELPLKKGTFITRDHDRFRKIAVGGGFQAINNKWWFDEVVFECNYNNTAKQIQGIEHNIQEAESFSDALTMASSLERKDFFLTGLDFDFDLAYSYTIFKFQDKAMHRYKWDGTIYPAITPYGGEINTPSDACNSKNVIVNKLNLNYLLNKWSSINLSSTFNLSKGTPSDMLKDKAIGHKTNFNSTMYNWVAGLNYEIRLCDNKLTNSITGKYYQYRMQTKLSPPFDFNTIEIEDVDNLKTDIGISEAIRYHFINNFLIKASASYDVRLPSDNELLGDGFMVRASADLIPERNTSINVGLMYDKNNSNGLFSVEINGFYMYLENMIRFVGGPLQSHYMNFGKMRTLGGEIEVKCDATSFLYLYANATYQDLRDARNYEPGSSIPNATKNDRMPNIPYLFTNAGIEMHKENVFGGKEQNSRLFADLAFVEEYFYDFEQSIYQQRRIPRATTINTGIEHSFKNQRYIIGFQANNITDATVISEFNRPLPGRNFAVKFRYVFK